MWSLYTGYIVESTRVSSSKLYSEQCKIESCYEPILIFFLNDMKLVQFLKVLFYGNIWTSLALISLINWSIYKTHRIDLQLEGHLCMPVCAWVHVCKSTETHKYEKKILRLIADILSDTMYLKFTFSEDRLRNFKVVLGDVPPPVPYGRQLDSTPYRLCVKYRDIPPAVPTNLPCLPSAVGRYTFVSLPHYEYLTICEFEAYGIGE